MGRGRGRRDNDLIGQTVRISQGPYKGKYFCVCTNLSKTSTGIVQDFLIIILGTYFHLFISGLVCGNLQVFPQLICYAFIFTGYIGVVKDATESTARVELHSTCQTISVDRQRLTTVYVFSRSIQNLPILMSIIYKVQLCPQHCLLFANLLML